MKSILCLVLFVYAVWAENQDAVSVNNADAGDSKSGKIGILFDYVVRTPMSWSEANSYCQKDKRKLPVFQTTQDLSTLLLMLVDDYDIWESWTGGRGAISGDGFVWLTEGNKPITLPEMNDNCDDTYGLAVKLNRTGMHGIRGSEKLPFVCQG